MSIVLQLPQDIHKLCRTCMKLVDDQEESFEHKLVLDNQLTELSKMLENVTTLKISIDDALPQSLCSQCTEYLNIAYLFKNHCTNVDKELRELILMSDSKENLSSIVESRFSTTNLEAGTFLCHICLSSFKSDYELSLHAVEHNKGKSLSERFKEHHEIKPRTAKAEQGIYEQIFERKLYSLEDPQENVIQNQNHIGVSNSDSAESNATSDLEDEMQVVECATCRICFSTQEELNNHICNIDKHTVDVSSEAIFRCPLCLKHHSSMVSLSIHFLKHAFMYDLTSEPCFCEVCGQLFDNNISLDEHYHNKVCDKPMWVCTICNIDFETESMLLVHNTAHDGLENCTPPGKIPCALCDEIFVSKDTLLSHTLTHLMKRYACKECSILFCTQQAYFHHLKIHPGYQYACIICGHLSKTKNALKCHVNGVHADGPSYQCKVCNKNFKTPGRLKTHSHIHESQKNYMCSYCGYTTHKSSDLQIHIRSHTSERPYKCTFAQCNMRFKTSSHLCSHLRRHLNIRNFVCSVCGASFGTRHSLKVHDMLHTGEKPHHCIVCGQNFRRKYHLKVHMKQHET